MILEMVQKSKDLFSAGFEIINAEREVGHVYLQGKLGSMEAQISGVFNNVTINMSYGNESDLELKITSRPYTIFISNLKDGVIYRARSKASIFKQFDFQQMIFKNTVYNLYPISFGKDGGKSPIYCGNEQIAQVNKDCIVYNDLHDYHIYAKDDYAAKIAVIFCIYMYINAGYKPGEKVTKSVAKTYNKTTNKLLLAKYDPNFIHNITGI